MNARRIHVTGGPGSGKTHFARRLGRELGVPVYDQDGEALAVLASMGSRIGDAAVDLPSLHETLRCKMEAFAAQEAWVSEGSALIAAEPLFERAEAVVLLDCAWRVAAYRILARHVKAELGRNNRFPGWRRLYRFWRFAIRYYRNRNGEPGLNDYGVPRNHSYLVEHLRQHSEKLVVCRTREDIQALERLVSSRA